MPTRRHRSKIKRLEQRAAGEAINSLMFRGSERMEEVVLCAEVLLLVLMYLIV